MSQPAPDAPPVEEPVTPAVEAEKPEPQEETVTLSKAEVDALRRGQSEAERRAKRLEDQQKKAAEEQAAQQGEWQKLAEQRQAELETERGERTRVEREQRITRLASKLKFVDPQDAVFRVRGELGDSDDAAMLALEEVASSSPHLIAKEAPAVPEIGQVLTPSAPGVPGVAAQADGKPNPPAGKPPVHSLDEWEALPQSERIARMAEADWLAIHEQQ